MNDKLMTLKEAIAAIVAKHGGVNATARSTGVDKSYISYMLNGRKTAPSSETLAKLGVVAVPLYALHKEDIK